MFCLTTILSVLIGESDNANLYKVHPDQFQCGRNAVYLLLKMEGRAARYPDIMEGVTVDVQGVSVKEVSNQLDKFGLPSKIIKCTPQDLPRIPTPYIMFTHTPKGPDDVGHFVVVVAITDKTLEVINATTGVKQVYDRDRISNIWDGILIVPNKGRSLAVETILLLGAIVLFALSLNRKARVPSRDRARPHNGAIALDGKGCADE